jgi:anti-sigma factor RsiW
VSDERLSDDDVALDAAIRALPEPELPAELSRRLEAIPERGNVRRFPRRAWRGSAFVWAAAAAIGLFVGAQTAETDSTETAADDTGASLAGEPTTDDEDETLALAVGSFTEFEEEP